MCNYIDRRVDKMNYKKLREQDLEVSSGAVEGAVNYVIAKRFDSGGMRWIKERAEPLLQLRCIEVNDDWDAFIEFVHDRTREQAQQQWKNLSLKRTNPAPLRSACQREQKRGAIPMALLYCHAWLAIFFEELGLGLWTNP